MSQVECPHHPGMSLLAYQQTSFATPCTLELNPDGSVEIEMGERAEFERNMETTTIVCYLCSVDGCDWSVLPEQLSRYRGLTTELQESGIEVSEYGIGGGFRSPTAIPVSPGMATDENGACPLCGRFLRNASHVAGCPGVEHADEIELMDEGTWRAARWEQDVKEKIVDAEPVKRDDETLAEFNKRRADYHLAVRESKRPQSKDANAKDPMDKFKGVFGGS